MQYLCLNADVQTLSHFPSRKACRGEFCLFLVDKPTDLIAGNSDHNAVFVLEHWRSNFSVTEDPNFRHGKFARFWWTSPLVVLPEIWTIMMQNLCLNVGVRFLFRHGRFHRPLRKVWSSLVDKPIGFIAWNFDHIAVFVPEQWHSIFVRSGRTNFPSRKVCPSPVELAHWFVFKR